MKSSFPYFVIVVMFYCLIGFSPSALPLHDDQFDTTAAGNGSFWSSNTRLPRRQQRRQLPTEINIQVTAPLFSSRMYDFGTEQNDAEFDASVDSTKRVQLKHPIVFFGESFDTVFITSSGAIGFEEKAKAFKTERFPAGPKLIAPLWNRNDLRQGGKVFYREVTEGRVLERAESEVRYQYEKKARPSSVLLVTWYQMQPIGQSLPAANTNSFQIALISTENGTFANCIYKNIGWSQGAQAGFNKGDGQTHYTLPTSGSGDVRYFEQVGNTGIPGEWMFEIDMPTIARCKPGIKGDTCENECTNHEWGYDCANCCHCAKGGCNAETGQCQKDSECSQCWGPAPFCQTRDDSCRIRSDGCGANAISFTDYDRCGEPVMRCQCLAGYHGDGHTCQDVDECEKPGTCGPLANCLNTPGKYYCECPDGLVGDGFNCTAAGARVAVTSELSPVISSEPSLLGSNLLGELTLSKDTESSIVWNLEPTFRIFGQNISQILIASSGLVSLDDPGTIDPHRDLDAQNVHGFAPFYTDINLSQGGSVYVNQLSEPSVLATASALLDRHYRNVTFAPQTLLLITYVNISTERPDTFNNGNTFQMALIGAANVNNKKPATFAVYIYKAISWSQGTQAMILADEPENSVVLPGSGTDDVYQLALRSNIGEPGIWLYRVDTPSIALCPNERQQPPFCGATLDIQTTPLTLELLPSNQSHPLEQQLPQEATPVPNSSEQQTFKLQPVLNTSTDSPEPFESLTTIAPAENNSVGEEETVTFPAFITVIPNIVTPGRGGPVVVVPSVTPATSSDSDDLSVLFLGSQVRRNQSLFLPDLGASNTEDQTKTTLLATESFVFSVGTPPQPSVVLVTPRPRHGNQSQRTHKPSAESRASKSTSSAAIVITTTSGFVNGNGSVIQPVDIGAPVISTSDNDRSKAINESSSASQSPTIQSSPQDSSPADTSAAVDLLPSLQIFTASPKPSPPPQTTHQQRLPPFIANHSRAGGGPRIVTGVRPTKPTLSFDSKSDDLGDTSELSAPSKLAIIIPTVIVGVWLLLLLIIGLVVCCRRRRNRRRLKNKYNPYKNNYRHHHNNGVGGGLSRACKDSSAQNSNSSGYPAVHGSYEDHLEKAARLSELPQSQYNQNGGRVSLYNSYWNVPSGRSQSQYPSGGSSSYYNQGYYESCPEFSRFGFSGRY